MKKMSKKKISSNWIKENVLFWFFPENSIRMLAIQVYTLRRTHNLTCQQVVQKDSSTLESSLPFPFWQMSPLLSTVPRQDCKQFWHISRKRVTSKCPFGCLPTSYWCYVYSMCHDRLRDDCFSPSCITGCCRNNEMQSQEACIRELHKKQLRIPLGYFLKEQGEKWPKASSTIGSFPATLYLYPKHIFPRCCKFSSHIWYSLECHSSVYLWGVVRFGSRRSNSHHGEWLAWQSSDQCISIVYDSILL